MPGGLLPRRLVVGICLEKSSAAARARGAATPRTVNLGCDPCAHARSEALRRATVRQIESQLDSIIR